ncbi:MAG: hypothetical protein FVQ82_11335 [Planctomycetes bacterium]|nr:hypothetical protein [Planctomycetota bacterium]
MSQKMLVALTVVSLTIVMFFAGCGTELAIKFNPDDISTYKVGYQTKQSVILDMAADTKTGDQYTSKNVDVTFTQEIQSINDDLTALAKITIMDIMFNTKDNKGASFSFDSRKDEDRKRPLNAIIGKSYTINISTDGRVTLADATDIRKVRVSGTTERRVAESLLTEAEIIKRHEIHLPNKEISTISRGRGWSKVVWSHPKVMAVKSFEKNYVLKSITDDGIANVTMTAYETDKIADGQPPKPGLFALLAKSFDSQEKYTGQMQIDLESGKVVKWSETCDAAYIITQEDLSKSFNKGSGKSKDDSASLKMSLLHTISLEKLD